MNYIVLSFSKSIPIHRGDSGGPLLLNGIQVGIVSWSVKPCTIAPYPGVFTEVAYYIDWIRQHSCLTLDGN
uniref:Uncharacterized protein n=1 Tax=Phlebotomus papatasi TaxID=29031 RepID=A0A1B0DG28_PHLPP